MLHQEDTVFDDREARAMALGHDNGAELDSISFRVEEKYSKLKSEGGVVRFDRYSGRDVENLERLKEDLAKYSVSFKEVLNEKDDTIDVKVTGKGYPVYDLVDYIQIFSDKTDIKDRPVTKRDRARYARRFNAWKAGRGAESLGLPLSQWPGITKSMVNEFANNGIHTVEQLANVPDGTIARIGPIQAFKQKAKAYLEASKGLAVGNELRAENQELRQQLMAQQEQVAAMQAQMAELIKPKSEPAPELKSRRTRNQEAEHG